MADYAIIVRNAQKQYSSKTPILNGLNLNVKKGTIYGLLGASGCGKTTLLSCIVGVRKLDEGDIWVLGGRPGSQGSGIPGPRVGYMPQEISLCSEFSVLGSLYYFGRVNNMEDSDIEERFEVLKDLLQLPPKDRLIKNLSGGQQRRVSFAAALVHKPELLILDEPTVGLDPVLRDNIWNYLINLTEQGKTTVIITTHYVEETKEAHTIGLLRGGLLLAESSPTELLQKYQTESLEVAFLALSQMQTQGQEIPNSPMQFSPEINIQDMSHTLTHGNNMVSQSQVNTKQHTAKKMHALILKNMMQFVRNPGGCLFAIILPLIQTLIFFASIGGDPHGLKMYVINEEAGDCSSGSNWGNISYNETEYTCQFKDLSCRFIHDFGNSIAEQVFFDSLEAAKEEIKSSHYVGVIHYSRNFSQAFEHRLENIREAGEVDITASEIQIWLDMGDRQIGLHTRKKLSDRFFEIFKDMVSECRIPPKFADMPLRFEQPIFGEKDQNYRDFVAPTFIVSIVFFLATAVCSAIIITDRHDGIWDRSLVQGVRTSEILFAHLITQLIIVILQVIVTLSVSFGLYNMKCEGSFVIIILLTLLSGICGMCYGFLISVICTTHTFANFISTGTFYPAILLCGCMWPIEGMPKLLRWFSMFLPTTIPGISFRAIVEKGKAFYDPDIYVGFIILVAWIILFTSFSLYRLKRKDI